MLTHLEQERAMQGVETLLSRGQRDGVIGGGPTVGELLHAVRVMAQILKSIQEEQKGEK